MRLGIIIHADFHCLIMAFDQVYGSFSGWGDGLDVLSDDSSNSHPTTVTVEETISLSVNVTGVEAKGENGRNSSGSSGGPTLPHRRC